MNNRLTYFIVGAALALAGVSVPAVAALRGSMCEPVPPVIHGPATIYEDGLSLGWSITHDAHVSWSEVAGYGGSGDLEVKVDFAQAAEVLDMRGSTTFPSDGFGTLTFTLRSLSGGQNLGVQLLGGGQIALPNVVSTHGYLPEGVVQPADRTISIPLTALTGNQTSAVTGVRFKTGAVGTVYLDDVKLEPPTPGLITLFSDHLHAAADGWASTASLDSDAFAGSHALKVNVTNTFGGRLFHYPGGYSTNDYGALTFAVKSDTPNLGIFPYVETADGQLLFGGVSVSDYVYNGDITNEWKVVWIPLRDLTNDQTVEIVNLYLEFNQPGVVWLDEVKVVRGLEFPLKNGWTPWTSRISSVFDHWMEDLPYRPDGQVIAWTGEVAAGPPSSGGCYLNVNPGQDFSVLGMYVGGGIGCTEVDRLNYDGHPGIDYAAGGVSVYPAARGKVMSNQCWTYNAGETCASWGAVGVDHGNGYITQYWHMRDIQVQPGQTVTTDTVLGTASDVGIPGALHLHFEVAKRVGGTYVHVDPYGWAGSFDTDPYTKARNVCLWQTGCP